MKKASRFAALLAAVMLFGSVAAMPALAAEGEPSAPVPTPTTEPTVTPNNSGSAYIIAQTVTDAAGGEITTIDRDSRFNLILRVADYGCLLYTSVMTLCCTTPSPPKAGGYTA